MSAWCNSATTRAIPSRTRSGAASSTRFGSNSLRNSSPHPKSDKRASALPARACSLGGILPLRGTPTDGRCEGQIFRGASSIPTRPRYARAAESAAGDTSLARNRPLQLSQRPQGTAPSSSKKRRKSIIRHSAENTRDIVMRHLHNSSPLNGPARRIWQFSPLPDTAAWFDSAARGAACLGTDAAQGIHPGRPQPGQMQRFSRRF